MNLYVNGEKAGGPSNVRTPDDNHKLRLEILEHDFERERTDAQKVSFFSIQGEAYTGINFPFCLFLGDLES